MLKFSYDYWNNLETPSFVLCNTNKNKLGILNVTKKRMTYNNNIPEISFTMHKYINGKENPYYNSVQELQYVYLENIGYFQITSKPEIIEKESLEYKEIVAQSTECEFVQKYLNTFTINMGTVESIDGVSLYNIADIEHSLLHLVLEKLPSWSIGHVDNSLVELQRSFQIDNQDVYSFITSDIATAFGCIFFFDTINNLINVYAEDSVSENTDIVISFKNLLKEVKIDPNIDSIKTCVTLVGDDDLTVRELNIGYNKIYDFSYFHNLDYMSQDLYDALTAYQTKYQTCKEQYTPIINEYQSTIVQIAYLTSEMLPDKPDSTDWTQYSLNELNTKKKSYENRQSVLMESGYGDPNKSEYKTLYKPVYDTLNSINAEIKVRENQINALEKQKYSLNIQMQEIVEQIDITKNFTKSQWEFLSKFIREDTIQDSNFVTTDAMTEEEILDMKQSFLDFGNKELSRVSHPQCDFTMTMANIYAIKEFRDKLSSFDLYNYITILIRDDYFMKVKILSFEIDFEDKSNFSVRFGSINKLKPKSQYGLIKDAISATSSAATSVAFNKYQWNTASDNASDIGNMISSGLISAGVGLTNSRSTMVIDERGVFMKNTEGSQYENDQAALTGSNILFTDDGWKTVKTALGRITYTKSGTQVSAYGLIAEIVLAGYIAGCTIEGNTINGNEIKGNTITGGTITGTSINNGNGTFTVDDKGNLKCTKTDVTGKITATSGKIGDWIVDGDHLYNNIPYTGDKKTDSTGMGKYGSDWAFWAGNGRFSVKQNGYLYASNAEISGKITATSGSFTGTVNASNGVFNNCTISSCTIGSCTIQGTCTVQGQSIIGTIGNSVSWNGSAISDGYLEGLTASKLSGTIGIPMNIGGIVVINSGGITSNSSNIFSNASIGRLNPNIPEAAGGSYIGSASNKFGAVYASVLVGTVSSGSSRKIKTNIESVTSDFCLNSVNETSVMKYNYKSDVENIDEKITNITNRKNDYISNLSLPETEAQHKMIQSFDDDITEIKNKKYYLPEKRYGFISEDAPWEIVSQDRTTVDIYSCVAMAYGAIQELHKKMETINTEFIKLKERLYGQ